MYITMYNASFRASNSVGVFLLRVSFFGKRNFIVLRSVNWTVGFFEPRIKNLYSVNINNIAVHSLLSAKK